MSPRIAVVTPYHKEPLEVLRQCHESVVRQSAAADHFLIADGAARTEVDGWKATHVALPAAHADNGNTPRGIGCMLADSEGYDFIAYLDADNWFHPDHLRSLLSLWEGARNPVCASLRTFHAQDGALLQTSERDENELRHIDTSCLMIHRAAFGLNALWLRMPKEISPICDRIYVAALRVNRFAISFSRQRTVAFRSQYEVHYRAAGLEPPENSKAGANMAPCFDYLRSLRGVAETVDRLGFYPLPHIGN